MNACKTGCGGQCQDYDSESGEYSSGGCTSSHPPPKKKPYSPLLPDNAPKNMPVPHPLPEPPPKRKIQELSVPKSNTETRDELAKKAFADELSKPVNDVTKNQIMKMAVTDELVGAKSLFTETGSPSGGTQNTSEGTSTTNPVVKVYTFTGAGSGSSSRGHIAVEIDGMMYSKGPKGVDAKDDGSILKNNAFRSAVVRVLNLSPDDAAHLEKTYINDQKENIIERNYNSVTNNCGEPLENALEDLGYDLGVNITPKSLSYALDRAGLVRDYYIIPRSKEPDGLNSPWTDIELPVPQTTVEHPIHP